MPVLANRARMSTSTTGTGTLTLGSPSGGFQSFADAGIMDGNTVRYVIEDINNEYEIGLGVYTASGTTLTRTPSESSNAGAAINLTGNAVVFISAGKEELQRAADMDQGVATTDSPTFAGVNLTGSVTSDAFTVASATGAETMITATKDGAVELYYDDTLALSTAAGGTVDIPNGLVSDFGTFSSGIAIPAAGNASFGDIGEMVVGFDGTDGRILTFAPNDIVIQTDATDRLRFSGTGDITASANFFLNADPTANLQAATKQYVDTIAAAGLHYHTPVRVEEPTALTVTYNNGTAGVGATLTNAGTQAALVLDGVTLNVADRVLIYQQADATQNGIYTVTDVGSGSTNWVLTRAVDADSYGPSDPDSLGQGDAFFVLEGNTGAGELYVMNTEGTITFGTTNITFVQVASTAVYSAGNGIALTGTVFSVAAGTGLTQEANGLAHADTSTQASVDNSGNTFIQDITLDGFGHITALTSATAVINDGTITLTAGTGLSGGGDFTTNQSGNETITFNVDLSELTTSTTDGDGDFFAVVDASNVTRKLTKGNINISGFNNDAGYTTNIGDITGVTAGTGLSGGGASGSVTLNLDLNELTTSTADADGDFFAVVDSVGAQKKLTKGNIAISGFNNDAGYTTNAGTVTSVNLTAGNAITVSGGPVTSTGSITVNHADTSSQPSVNNSGNTFIQDITLDGFGHITAINSATVAATSIPTGVVVLWSGSVASIPSGWALCDGTSGTPDLRDRFVVGAGSTYAVDATGGAATVTLLETNLPGHTHSVSGTTASDGAHTHTVSGNTSNTGDHSHTGTTSNTGNHSHNIAKAFGSTNLTQFATSGNNFNFTGNQATSNTGAHSHNFTTSNTGAHSHTLSGTADSAGAHTHTFSATSGSTGGGTAHENLPPYYALAYIMKT